ncbi:MAG: hypothetical protein QOF14_2673 [Hyphomicrobiales bacterium]|nr:hypothetical protein [Hyphomicrobiales bacterium]
MRAKSKSYRRRNTPPLGPIAGLVRVVLERICDLSAALGDYEAYVALMVVVGVVALHFAQPNTIMPVCTLILVGIVAPLIAWWMRR